MDRSEVKRLVVRVISANRDKDHDTKPLSDLSDDVRPALGSGGVSGFDSLSGIAGTVDLESELGIKIDSDNIFLSPSGNGARTVGQIVDALLQLQPAGSAA